MLKTPYERVIAARAADRPTGMDYIRNLVTDFMEFHGDRRYGDDPAVVGGVGWMGQTPVTVIAMERGRGVKDRVARNFGSAHPEGYRKALRLMKQAEKFGRPVLCLIDTSGAHCGQGAEERGQGQAIAENIMEMSAICVPVLSILIGEGESGGALALAAGDRVWMLESAVYSVISPEGCASILWKNAEKASEAAKCLKLTAEDARSLSVIERIISEKNLGKEAFYENLRNMILEELSILSTDPELLNKRYDRFRRIGLETLKGV